jgi:hypothetical protein
MAKDKCIYCGEESDYDYETHIHLRVGYIEGAGQLCRKCYSGDNTTSICVSQSLVERTPNNQELGEIVRDIYFTKTNKHV